MSRSLLLRLADMIDCCQRVIEYRSGMSFEAFVRDRRTFDAVVRNLELLGEAAKHVPEAVRLRHPEIAWRKIAGLRDVLSHGYFALELETLWEVVEQRVPALLAHLPAVLGEETRRQDRL